MRFMLYTVCKTLHLSVFNKELFDLISYLLTYSVSEPAEIDQVILGPATRRQDLLAPRVSTRQIKLESDLMVVWSSI